MIRLDFNEISNDTPEQFKESIKNYLYGIARDEGVEISRGRPPKETFIELVKSIYEKYNKSIVFLIDEYDKPIIDHIGKGGKELNVARENREILKDFYGILKGQSVVSRTRFVFITGVTKFSKVSIFSELNNLNDLRMDKRYCTLLGITEDEMERYLKPYIERFCDEEERNCDELQEELRDYYNGYRFSEKDVKV